MNLLGIILLFCLSLMPTILLAQILRIPPVHRFAQRNRLTRILAVALIGLLCLGIYFLMLNWGTAAIYYAVGEFYFDTIFGLVPGITRANLEQFHWATVNEIALRQLALAGSGPACFGGNATACKLADAATKLSSPTDSWSFLLQMALVATLINVGLSWKTSSTPPAAPDPV
jgi:hypothetical protein